MSHSNPWELDAQSVDNPNDVSKFANARINHSFASVEASEQPSEQCSYENNANNGSCCSVCDVKQKRSDLPSSSKSNQNKSKEDKEDSIEEEFIQFGNSMYTKRIVDYITRKEGQLIENRPPQDRLSKILQRKQFGEVVIGLGFRLDVVKPPGKRPRVADEFPPSQQVCIGWVIQLNKPQRSTPGLEDYFILECNPQFQVASREMQPALLIYSPIDLVLKKIAVRKDDTEILLYVANVESPRKTAKTSMSPGKWITISRIGGPTLWIIRPKLPSNNSTLKDPPLYEIVVTFDKVTVTSSKFVIKTKNSKIKEEEDRAGPSIWHLLDPEMNADALAMLTKVDVVGDSLPEHPQIPNAGSQLSARRNDSERAGLPFPSPKKMKKQLTGSEEQLRFLLGGDQDPNWVPPNDECQAGLFC